MKHVVKGVLAFQKAGFEQRKQLFNDLATGQNPNILFITCSDSRIDPNLLTDSEPGGLFICRNAGNIVPPHNNTTGGVTASIEYAVTILGVKEVIICGHTDCGAMKGVISPESLEETPHVKEWLSNCTSAKNIVKAQHGFLDHTLLDQVTQANVFMQLQHLRTHPCIATKLAMKQIRIHGWVYSIKSGRVNVLDESTNEFIHFENAYPDLIAEGLLSESLVAEKNPSVKG